MNGVRPETKMQSVANWFKQRHFKKVGILQEEDAFSESETPPLVSELKAAGIQTTIASFSAATVDVKPQISELFSLLAWMRSSPRRWPPPLAMRPRDEHSWDWSQSSRWCLTPGQPR
jgi:hypothetical protein